jgi:hypothetical protein
MKENCIFTAAAGFVSPIFANEALTPVFIRLDANRTHALQPFASLLSFSVERLFQFRTSIPPTFHSLYLSFVFTAHSLLSHQQPFSVFLSMVALQREIVVFLGKQS